MRNLKTLIGVIFSPRKLTQSNDLRPDHAFKVILVPLIVIFVGSKYYGWAKEEIEFRLHLKKSKHQMAKDITQFLEKDE
eukprot:gene1304-11388_t